MAKWGSSPEIGILRKRNAPACPEELLVFGYACKLFRDDAKALYIDQGKHLIPWMGSEALRIDRYDGRGALSELHPYEAGSEGYDARRWLGLSEAERRLEQLCDEERYYSLRNNEEEEELYKEEELKRLHRKGGEFQYTYDVPADPDAPQEATVPFEEEDEDFVPPPELDLPTDIAKPKTVKENARIEKTALFVSQQGMQMEILIKTKQADNPQFSFLNHDDPLYKYYKWLLVAIKEGKYRVRGADDAEREEPAEQEGVDAQPHYLHPSLTAAGATTTGHACAMQLAAPPPSVAPTLPPLTYRPNANCAYTQLVSRIQGAQAEAAPSTSINAHAPSTYDTHAQMYQQYYYAAQYYEYYKQMAQQPDNMGDYPDANYMQHMHAYAQMTQPTNPYAQIVSNIGSTRDTAETEAKPAAAQPPPPPPPPVEATPTATVQKKKAVLPMLAEYASDSDEETSEGKKDVGAEPEIPNAFMVPPNETRQIIDKMAVYVSKNGKDFENIVRAKADPRFDFLMPGHEYHAYYLHKTKEAGPKPVVVGDKEPVNGVAKVVKEKEKKIIMPVSFSIKKSKEESTKEIKSALPMEESDEDGGEANKGVEVASSTPPIVEKAPTPVGSPRSLTPPPISEATPTVAEKAVDGGELLEQEQLRIDTDELIMEMIDLTDDLEEKKETRTVELSRKDKMVAAAREKVALQLERKRKAAEFLRLKSVETSNRAEPNNENKKTRCKDTSDVCEIIESESEEGEIRRHRHRSHKKKKSHKRKHSRSRTSETTHRHKDRKRKKRHRSNSNSSRSS